MHLTYAIAAFAGLIASSYGSLIPRSSTQPSCKNVTVHLTSSKAGPYQIAGLYCTPTKVVASRQSHLQVLVHGFSYTRRYWSGLTEPKSTPDKYSWIQYSANLGYPTLSIDRVCNGHSTFLNATVCDLELNADSLHGVVTAARSGTITGLSSKFSKIIVVGHSLGSSTTNVFASKYPNDADSLVLTGFSVSLGGIAGLKYLGIQSAQQAYPEKYAYLNDPTYVIATNRSGVRLNFYFGGYDPQIFDFDYQTRGTGTNAELGLPSASRSPANYTGSVFVLNGNEDFLLCNTQEGAEAGRPGNCSAGYSSGVRGAYPAASKFGFFNIPNTGHCLNTHFRAQEGYKAAHDFLASAGF